MLSNLTKLLANTWDSFTTFALTIQEMTSDIDWFTQDEQYDSESYDFFFDDDDDGFEDEIFIHNEYDDLFNLHEDTLIF
ncbi:MAG: hypothetical protein ACI9T7_000154 [Oleiphilaceae bacterium]|jgi:hypothetical protein